MRPALLTPDREVGVAGVQRHPAGNERHAHVDVAGHLGGLPVRLRGDSPPATRRGKAAAAVRGQEGDQPKSMHNALLPLVPGGPFGHRCLNQVVGTSAGTAGIGAWPESADDAEVLFGSQWVTGYPNVMRSRLP